LSFWYLPSTNGNRLIIRLSGNGINSSTQIAPPSGPTRIGLYSPGALNTVAASLPAFPPLWINEVMPNNLTNLADRLGHFAPWLELYNGGTNSVNLGGFYLTDNYTNLAAWAFPSNATINAGQFLTVFADGAPAESTTAEWHTSFKLNATTGTVALVQVLTNKPRVLDYVNYRLVGPNRSYGSLPDGQPIQRQLFSIPTPGAANNGACPPVQVFINEWMADNLASITDPADGRREDWFELYNAGSGAVDLTGYTLTDNLSLPRQYVVPAGKTIPAGGFLLVWADQDTSQNSFGPDLHVNFQLSKSGEAIALYDPNEFLIDSVTFGPQTNDLSQGRWPDGYPNIIAMANPTPGAPNFLAQANTPPSLAPIADQTVDEGVLLSVKPSALDQDQPAQRLTFSLGTGAPAGAAIDAASGEFTWTPSEAQGPGVYFITLGVTDNGTPPLSTNRVFKVTVHEVNSPPDLAPIIDRTVSVLNLLTFTNRATDTDLPANSLTFTLEDAPPGAAIDPASGVFAWTPSAAQGPRTYTMSIRVTDDGVPSANAFRPFTVTVTGGTGGNGPRISVTRTNGLDVTLTWPATSGKTYQVQSKDDLAAPAWAPLGNAIPAAGPTAAFTDHPGMAQRFYRVMVLAP
jgi:hypothetical protein